MHEQHNVYESVHTCKKNHIKFELRHIRTLQEDATFSFTFLTPLTVKLNGGYHPAKRERSCFRLQEKASVQVLAISSGKNTHRYMGSLLMPVNNDMQYPPLHTHTHKQEQENGLHCSSVYTK